MAGRPSRPPPSSSSVRSRGRFVDPVGQHAVLPVAAANDVALAVADAGHLVAPAGRDAVVPGAAGQQVGPVRACDEVVAVLARYSAAFDAARARVHAVVTGPAQLQAGTEHAVVAGSAVGFVAATHDVVPAERLDPGGAVSIRRSGRAPRVSAHVDHVGAVVAIGPHGPDTASSGPASTWVAEAPGFGAAQVACVARRRKCGQCVELPEPQDVSGLDERGARTAGEDVAARPTVERRDVGAPVERVVALVAVERDFVRPPSVTSPVDDASSSPSSRRTSMKNSRSHDTRLGVSAVQPCPGRIAAPVLVKTIGCPRARSSRRFASPGSAALSRVRHGPSPPKLIPATAPFAPAGINASAKSAMQTIRPKLCDRWLSFSARPIVWHDRSVPCLAITTATGYGGSSFSRPSVV